MCGSGFPWVDILVKKLTLSTKLVFLGLFTSHRRFKHVLNVSIGLNMSYSVAKMTDEIAVI